MNSKEKALNAINRNLIETDIYNVDDRTIHIDFSYPRIGKNINKIILGLSDVRAADLIRISYDFDRDGYLIEQSYEKATEKDNYISCDEIWEEVAFIQAWGLEEKGDKQCKL